MADMTLEQVRDWHRNKARAYRTNCEEGHYDLADLWAAEHDKIADAIKRELDARKGVVTPEMTDIAVKAFQKFQREHSGPDGTYYLNGAVHAALESTDPMLAGSDAKDAEIARLNAIINTP